MRGASPSSAERAVICGPGAPRGETRLPWMWNDHDGFTMAFRMNRRHLLCTSAGALAATWMFGPPASAEPRRKPNFIIVLCDDLGYGDIEPTGGKSIPTPNLNRLAREGLVLTDYYAPQNICTPSRAGMLTGRYPIRTGLGWGAILQFEKRTLPLSEVTIPHALKPAGYVSGLFGKWHLGHQGPDWQPTKHGFDRAVGIPYSHDQLPLWIFTDTGPDAPPKREDIDPKRETAAVSELQQRFYAEAESFIEANADRPFFVELALSAPHLPNYPNAKHRDPKMQSAYGEVVEEIDGIVGRLVAKLRSLGLERDTLVVFTSDNGPWFEGSTGGLRERKGDAGYDGGYRVPCIAWRPGVVPAGKRCNSIAMGIDFLPTFCAMAGVGLPAGDVIDGKDISAVLTRGAPSPHDALVLFNDEEVSAIRTQRWSYVASAYYHGRLTQIDEQNAMLHFDHNNPQLYDMSADPSQSYSVAEGHPDVLAEMQRRLADASDTFRTFKRGDPYRGVLTSTAAARKQD